MIGRISIDRVPGVHVDMVRIQVMSEDCTRHISEAQVTVTEFAMLIFGDTHRACIYEEFSKPEEDEGATRTKRVLR